MEGAATPAKREAFARSCIQLVEDYGLDGIDIDWEYPRNSQEAQNYVELLRTVREHLDQLADRKSERDNGYELTVAAVCRDFLSYAWQIANRLSISLVERATTTIWTSKAWIAIYPSGI